MEKFEQQPEQINIQDEKTIETREKGEMKSGKQWSEIMEEHINEFPEDIQEILKKRTAIYSISNRERDKLYGARDEFWLKKFDVTFEEWRGKRNTEGQITQKKQQKINLPIKNKDRGEDWFNRRKRKERRKKRKEGGKLLEAKIEKLKELNIILAIVSEELKREGVPVKSDCRIEVDSFVNFYANDEISNNKKRGRGNMLDTSESGLRGEKLEIIKTILFNKILGDKFVVVRSSFYDDSHNGVDNVVIEKESGNLVCMFDEVSLSSMEEKGKITRIAKKWRKVIKINKRGGAKLKYGLNLKKDNETGELSFESMAIDNIPIFVLSLNSEDILKLEKEITSHPLDGVSDYEKKMFRYLIASVIPQMQLLENENLKPELKEKIEQFKKVIEGI